MKTDSETRGWSRDQAGFLTKIIDGNMYAIIPYKGKGFKLRCHGGAEYSHERLDAAQKAAHKHAREKANAI